MALLSSDLVSPTDYTAGEELAFNLHFEAPANTEAEKFYILGALYSDTTYIPDTLFYILRAAGVDYGINDTGYLTLWELEPEVGVDLPCKFILGRTNCLLALFLMKMVGDEPSIELDEEVAQITVQLTAPVSVWEGLMPFVGGVMMLVMVGMMVSGMGKGLSKAS